MRYKVHEQVVMRDHTVLRGNGERDRRVQIVLACGHWTQPMHEASSTFDFPEDPLHCMVCGEDRYMNVDLMAHLRLVIERDKEN